MSAAHEMTNAERPRRIHFLEIPALLAVLSIVAVRSVASSDLTFADETSYLNRGLQIANGSWPRFSQSATYSDMYYLLSRIVSDPIDLYFAGRAVAAVVFVLGTWIAARLLMDRRAAWIVIAVVAVTPAPYVWPGVAAPATGLVLVALILAIKFDHMWSLGVVSGLLWLAAGSRPELTWLAVISSIAAITWSSIRVFRTRSISRQALGNVSCVLFGSIAVPAILASLHGSPFRSSGREWVAFGQHFSLQNAQLGEDPWLNWKAVVDRTFPGAESVGDALRINPSAFFGHMWSNLIEAPSKVFSLSTGENGLEWYESLRYGGLMLIVLVFGAVLSLILHRSASRTRLEQIRKALSNNVRRISTLKAAVIVGFLALPIIAIYPRNHYLLAFVSLISVAFTWLSGALSFSRWQRAVTGGLVVIVFGLFSMSTIDRAVSRVTNPGSLAANARELNSMGRDWRLLGVDRGLEIYVQNLEQISGEPVQDGETFTEYLERNRVNVILLNQRFMGAQWKAAGGFVDFFLDPESFGFEQLASGSQLWIKTP